MEANNRDDNVTALRLMKADGGAKVIQLLALLQRSGTQGERKGFQLIDSGANSGLA